MPHKAIIFDFFGVICCEVGAPWFVEHVKDLDPNTVKEKFTIPADKGEIEEEEFFEKLSESFHIPAKEIKEEWNSRISINSELISYIREELKPKYKIALLSNSPQWFFQKAFNKQDLSGIFEIIAVSSVTKLVKPHPEAFEYILNQLQVTPQEAIMVDDRIANINAAKSLGMEGILFTTTADLKSFLSA